jgi:hypothetical protein
MGVTTCFSNIGLTADITGGWLCTKAGLDVVVNSKPGTGNSVAHTVNYSINVLNEVFEDRPISRR